MIPHIIFMANTLKVYNNIMLSCTVTCYTNVIYEITKILTILSITYINNFLCLLPFSHTHKKYVIGWLILYIEDIANKHVMK